MNENAQEDQGCFCFKISAFEENGYVEVYGPGNMNITPILKDICYAMVNEEKSTIFLNMGNCTIVDSTFMGTLLNIQEFIETKNPEEGKLLIFNLNEENKRLFAMVGIDGFLKTITDSIEIPDFQLKTLDMCDVDRKEKLRVVVEAHEKLIEINEINKDKFDKFLSIVKSEMEEEGISKDE